MPETLSTPKLLLDWLSAMRDAADLAPMLVAIRGGTVVASGFIDPDRWNTASGVAFYGFSADVVALVMDSWVHVSPAETPEPDVDPAELYLAGDPDTTAALVVEWIDRHGPSVIVFRRYDRAAGGGLRWHEPDPPVQADGATGGATVSPTAVLDALAATEAQHAGRDEFMALPAGERDQATAHYLGLELR